MPEMNIDYETTLNVATALNNAEAVIVPQINMMHNQVDALLGPEGGFYMQHSSPAIQAQYETFNSNAMALCSNITSFAGMFQSLVTSLQSMDTGITNKITNPGS